MPVIRRDHGILSAAFLALTMGFVNISHYATVDVPMLFWMLAAFLRATHVLRGGDRKSHLLAGIFAGLAAGTKYPGGVVLLSLLAAHLLREGRHDHRALVYGVVPSAITFVAANPPMLLSSCEFFESFIKNAVFHAAEGVTGGAVALSVIRDIYHATGPALGGVILVCWVYALVLLYRQTYARETLILLSMLIQCFAVLLSKQFSIMRYVIPVILPLVIIAAKMMTDAMSTRNAFLRYVAVALTVMIVIASGAYTIAADLEIQNDSRELAAAWIDRNVPEGATIETTLSSISLGGDRGGVLSKRFNVVLRPKIYSDRLRVWVERIDETAIYRVLYPPFLAYASFAETTGLCDGQRPYFEGWYERQRSSANRSHWQRSIKPPWIGRARAGFRRRQQPLAQCRRGDT